MKHLQCIYYNKNTVQVHNTGQMVQNEAVKMS